MSGISRYGKTVLTLGVIFLLLCLGCWLAAGRQTRPYQVFVTRNDPQPQSSLTRQESWPQSLLPNERIDLNTAGVYDLARLPGIGEKRAEDIVTWRAEKGPFTAPEQLEEISGIGPKTLEGLRPYVTVG